MILYKVEILVTPTLLKRSFWWQSQAIKFAKLSREPAVLLMNKLDIHKIFKQKFKNCPIQLSHFTDKDARPENNTNS